MHPRDQIVSMMERIYGYGMTTTSGGNISILDDCGNIWISPAGVDKGTLTREDIVCVKTDGTIEGHNRPSSEFPFHRTIFEKRPDVKAIIHAHPPALVAFSIANEIPNTNVMPKSRLICGKVGYAKYAVPGSQELGDKIAAVFEKGYDSVLLENHGVATSGSDVLQAFQRFETLDFCARLHIRSRILGEPHILDDHEIALIKKGTPIIDEFVPKYVSSTERELRRSMIKFIHRSYSQMLCTSTEGTFSARVDDSSFLITPYGFDRKNLIEEDLVLVQNGCFEAGKTPSKSALTHKEVYDAHKKINAIMIAHPPNVMAYAVARQKFDSRTIPESYILLRDVPLAPFGKQMDCQYIVDTLSESNPMILFENDCLYSTGATVLQAFDRVEVAEYSAKALLDSKQLGPLAPISEAQIEDLKVAFNLK
jgi:L-fuculose-phosphate aldolase